MRRSLWLLVLLAACGKRADDEPKPARMADQEDPPCDPKTPKVCLDGNVVACEPTGKMGRALRICKQGCAKGKCKNTCSDEAVKLIYVVDDANHLVSFDPRLLPNDPFKIVGTLTCEPFGTPFSMSVDRHGIAWVVYDDGHLFKVDITDATCEDSGYRPGTTGSFSFGMGFASDAPGSETERLYMASDSEASLHALDTGSGSLVPERRGSVAATTEDNAELTGGSNAKLYGFFPNTGNAFVQEIDRNNGRALGPKWSMGSLGDVNAYAFAQWGGIFYVFTTTFDGGSVVRSLDPSGGGTKVVRSNLPFRITGAGVSTCAPERDGAAP